MKKLVKPRHMAPTGVHIGSRLIAGAGASLRAFSLIAALSLLGLGAQAATQLFPGVVKREMWSGKVRADVLNNTAGTPTEVTYPDLFEGPLNYSSDYAQRISGVFIPPTTGDYVFFLAADDDTDLFLSTDSTPANKKLIARESGWSGNRNYTTVGGGSVAADKRSDTFGASEWTPKGKITLTQGARYYIEAVHHEGGGGDNLSVYAATAEDAANGVPANGDAPNLTGDSIGLLLVVPTSLTFSTSPADTTAAIGTTVRFNAVVSTDSDDVLHYQWRRNDVNIPGATSPSYSTVVGASDNGAKFDVVVTMEHFPNTATSAKATLTVPATGNLVVTGKLKLEFFQGATGAAVINGTAGPATKVSDLSSFETPTNYGANYAQRVSGYFIPATTGNYNFIVTSDDGSNLYLSTDENPANKRLIAQQLNWSAVRTWATDSSDAANGQPQKRSNTWVPDPANPPENPPYADGIALEQGKKYYIEAVHTEGGGGDNLAATFHMAGSPVPDDGTASALTGDLIAYSTSNPTTLTITTPPADLTVTETFTATFNVAVNTDSAITPIYQWLRNGQPINGANSPSYTIVTSAADNGAKFSVKVSVNGTPLTVTSSEATLTVRSPVFATGFLKREFWQGPNRAAVEGGTAGNPNSISAISSFETGVNIGANYAQRVSGFVVPPADGDYVFFVASDDDSDLFLSTDSNPANKKLIARESGWSGSRNYNTVGGGSSLDDKRSDTFTASEWPTADVSPIVIHLVKGSRYYIEAVHAEGGGGDNLAVYMATAEDAANGIPANGEASNLTGDKIGFFVPPADITVTTPPANVSVTENRNATFTATATTTSQFGGISYQWQRNGQNIDGATGSSYTAKRVQLANNNDKYTVVVQAPGTPAVTSAQATLTVVADTVAPVAVAGAIQHKSSIQIGVGFDETVTPASAGNVANYTLSAGSVTSVRVVQNNGGIVNNRGEVVDAVLETTGIAAGQTVTLTVKDVADLKGNKIGSQAISVKVPTDVKWASVGSPFIEPTVAALGNDNYDVIGGGRAYWGTYDEVTFVYKEKTGDFDVKTQIIEQDFASRWARGGFAVREATDEDKTELDTQAEEPYLFSAYKEIHANPNQNDNDPNPNGQGTTANNGWEANRRIGIKYGAGANDTGGWGGGGPSPVYPNVWLRLKREGETIIGYRSTDGVEWTEMAREVWAGAPAKLLVGPAYGPESGNSFTDTALYPAYMIQYRHFKDTVESNPAPQITSVVRNANGSITVTWTGGGTLETTPAFTGNTTTWTAVDGAASPYTFTPPAGVPMLFGRIRVP